MVDGVRRERIEKGLTATQARRRLRALPDEIRAELSVVRPEQEGVAEADEQTFGGLLDDWLRHKSRGWAPKTTDENRREIETRIRPTLGDIALSKLTAKHLDDAYSTWMAEGLSESSVHRHAAIVSAALAQGVKWDYLDANPAAKASPPTQPDFAGEGTPDAQQVAVLIKTAQSDDSVMAAAIALAFVTGARRGELCALKWSDVDLEGGVVRITKSLSEVGRELSEKLTKTGKSRNVALDERSIALLRKHFASQAALADRVGSPLVDDPYVLSPNTNGALPMTPSIVTDRFTKLRTKARLDNVRFHDLRHAHISELLGAGTDPTTVATRVGHASTRMTLDRYAHALPSGDIAAAVVIGALLPD